MTAIRVYICWFLRYKDKEELGLLGKIKLTAPKRDNQIKSDNIEEPEKETEELNELVDREKWLKLLFKGKITIKKIDDDFRYRNDILFTSYIELLHLADLEVKKQIHEHQANSFNSTIKPKVENIINRSITSNKMQDTIHNLVHFKISKKMDVELDNFELNYINEQKKEMEWCLAKGLSQMLVRRVDNYLQYHSGKFDGESDEYFEFVENAINQYSQIIPYQQQNKAFQWLQKMKNPNTELC